MTEVIIKIKIEKNSGAEVPKYMTEGSSGMDISALLDEPVTINPLEIELIPTGLFMEIPTGFEAQIRPRSGLAIKSGITVVNAPGTIDSDYRGEIKVGLINLSKEPYTVKKGDRIAQMVIQKVEHAVIKQVDVIEETKRNQGGFGHTGI